MTSKRSTLSSATLLNKVLYDWEHQAQQAFEKRFYKLSPVPKKAGELKIDLKINTELDVNGMAHAVTVNSKPFYTTTLGIANNNPEYELEANGLKKVMLDLEEEFSRAVAIEKSKHTPQNDLE